MFAYLDYQARFAENKFAPGMNTGPPYYGQRARDYAAATSYHDPPPPPEIRGGRGGYGLPLPPPGVGVPPRRGGGGGGRDGYDPLQPPPIPRSPYEDFDALTGMLLIKVRIKVIALTKHNALTMKMVIQPWYYQVFTDMMIW